MSRTKLFSSDHLRKKFNAALTVLSYLVFFCLFGFFKFKKTQTTKHPESVTLFCFYQFIEIQEEFLL